MKLITTQKLLKKKIQPIVEKIEKLKEIEKYDNLY